jgi:dephospho-CoA kinase
MEKITLIGINGGIACGKDTLAQLIQYLILSLLGLSIYFSFY